MVGFPIKPAVVRLAPRIKDFAAMYCGDSDVDVMTAANAGIPLPLRHVGVQKRRISAFSRSETHCPHSRTGGAGVFALCQIGGVAGKHSLKTDTYAVF